MRTALIGGLLALAITLQLSGCDDAPGGTRLEHRAFVFGTVVDIAVYGLDPGAAEDAFSAVATDLDAWHRAWHPWQGEGLAAVNRGLINDGRAAVTAELKRLLERARRLEKQSGGRFTPAIGALVRAWGFHAADAGRLPGDDRIEALTTPPLSMEPLSWEQNTLVSADQRIQLDLGAFAKGVAAGRVADRLTEAGAAASIVNAGGDIVTRGTPPGRDWRIGVRSPDGTGVLAAITLAAGESVFTSGNYERGFEAGGRRYHHLLDPRTGRPARGLTSVTVIHRDPARADAAATALFVAGPEVWPEVAAAMGVTQAMVVRDDGRVEMTRAIAKRVELLAEPLPAVTLRSLP